MRNLLKWALCLTLPMIMIGCNQERNKSIELMNHGVEMGRQKLFDRAVSDLRQAVLIDPGNDLAYFNLGIVLKDQKKWSEAVSAFADAVKNSGDNQSYRYELGSAYQSQYEDQRKVDPLKADKRLLEQAKSEFEAALKLDNKLYKAHYRLGNILEAMEKYREADAEYRKAIEMNPRFIPPFVSLGNMYLGYDYDKEAVQVFQNAVLASSSDPDAHYGLGVALQKTKQYDDAVKEFRAALDLNGDMFRALYNLGMTYKMMDDKKNAKEWLKRFTTTAGSRGGPDLMKAAQDALYQLDAP